MFIFDPSRLVTNRSICCGDQSKYKTLSTPSFLHSGNPMHRKTIFIKKQGTSHGYMTFIWFSFISQIIYVTKALTNVTISDTKSIRYVVYLGIRVFILSTIRHLYKGGIPFPNGTSTDISKMFEEYLGFIYGTICEKCGEGHQSILNQF